MLNTSTLQITPEMLKLISELVEFKGEQFATVFDIVSLKTGK